jgi:hypothetical protein
MGHMFTVSVSSEYQDVTDWLLSLPRGERSRAVCAAIRAERARDDRCDRMLEAIWDEIQELRAGTLPHLTSSSTGWVNDPETKGVDPETAQNLGGLLE